MRAAGAPQQCLKVLVGIYVLKESECFVTHCGCSREKCSESVVAVRGLPFAGVDLYNATD